MFSSRNILACLASAMCLNLATAATASVQSPSFNISRNNVSLTPASNTTLSGCCLQWGVTPTSDPAHSMYAQAHNATNSFCSDRTTALTYTISSPTFVSGSYDFYYTCWSTNSTSTFVAPSQSNVTITIGQTTSGSSTGVGSGLSSSSGSYLSLSSSSDAPVMLSSGVSQLLSSSSGKQVNMTSSTGTIVNGTSSTGLVLNGTSSTGSNGNSTNSKSSSTGSVSTNGTSSTGSMSTNGTSSTGSMPNGQSSTGTVAPSIPENTMVVKFNVELSGNTVPPALAEAIHNDITGTISLTFNVPPADLKPFVVVTIGNPVSASRRLLSTSVPVTFTLLGNVTSVLPTTGGMIATPQVAAGIISMAISSGVPILSTSTASLGVSVPVQQVEPENLSPAASSTGMGDWDWEVSTSSSLSDGAIAGIVIGAVVGVLLLGGVGFAAYSGKLCFGKGAASVGVAHAGTAVHVKSTKDAEIV